MFRERARKARENPRTSLGRTGQGRGKSVAKEKSRQWLKFKPSGNLPYTAIKLEHAQPSLAQECARGNSELDQTKKTLGVFVNLHIVVPWFYTNSHHFIHGFMVNFWASRRQDSYAPPPRSKGYSSGSLAVSFLNLRWFIDIFRYAKTGIECKRMTWRMRFADICVYSFCFIWISKLVHFYEQMCFLGSPTKPFPTS